MERSRLYCRKWTGDIGKYSVETLSVPRHQNCPPFELLPWRFWFAASSWLKMQPIDQSQATPTMSYNVEGGEIMRSNTANYHISHFYLTVLPAPSSQVEYIFSCTWISHVDWSRINRCLTASPLTIENDPEGGCAYVLAVLLCVPGNNFLLCGIAHYASIRKLGILLIQPATRNSEQPFLKILIQFLKMSVWLIM